MFYVLVCVSFVCVLYVCVLYVFCMCVCLIVEVGGVCRIKQRKSGEFTVDGSKRTLALLRGVGMALLCTFINCLFMCVCMYVSACMFVCMFLFVCLWVLHVILHCFIGIC